MLRYASFAAASGAFFGIIVNYRQWNSRFSSLIAAVLLVRKIFSEQKNKQVNRRNIKLTFAGDSTVEPVTPLESAAVAPKSK